MTCKSFIRKIAIFLHCFFYLLEMLRRFFERVRILEPVEVIWLLVTNNLLTLDRARSFGIAKSCFHLIQIFFLIYAFLFQFFLLFNLLCAFRPRFLVLFFHNFELILCYVNFVLVNFINLFLSSLVHLWEFDIPWRSRMNWHHQLAWLKLNSYALLIHDIK